jgi:leader peptidase (prepilin peptidase)/N-methyltransferase
MTPIQVFHLSSALWFFVLGSVVGSFLNVVIYRLPYQKSVIWPASRCPSCLGAIAARDNVPILGWLLLRGECRRCGTAISARYMLVEALVGLLFVGVYAADVGFGPSVLFAGASFGELGYHLILVALLVAATFTDYDYQIIPAEITRTGTVLGLAIGAAFPTVRPVPVWAAITWGAFGLTVPWTLAGAGAGWLIRSLLASVFRRPTPTTSTEAAEVAEAAEGFGLPTIGAFLGWQVALLSQPVATWGGLVVGVEGMLIGGALVWVVSVLGRWGFRKEAMGFGDVTFLAMIGSFLGWQAAVLTFFLAPFFGLGHALWKIVAIGLRGLSGRKSSAADHEMPFGPYLGMAALFLILTWPRVWPLAAWYFATLGTLARYSITGEL